MIRKEKKMVEQEVTVEHTCDLCKNPIARGEYPYTEASVRIYTTYGEGEGGVSRLWDVCPKCFETVVEPFMRERTGISARENDW